MIVSPQKFAEIVGTTRENIYASIRLGTLKDGVSKKGTRYKIDLELARAQWLGHEAPESSVDEKPKEPSTETHYIPDLEDSQATEKYWKAKTAELNYRERVGELVEAAEVQKTYDDEVVACRTKLLALGPRIRQRIDMTEEGFGLVEELIEEALEELGRS